MQFKNKIFLQVGTFLINLIFFSLIITTTFFMLGIPMAQANLLLSFICSIIANVILFDKNWKQCALVALIGLLILVLTIVIANHSFDYSWDGNTYHKTMTGFMKNGWNPLKITFYDYADANFPTCSMLTQTWLDAYPKGSEMFAACIYAVTGNIESGKCFNLLGCLAMLLISFGMLEEMTGLRKWQTVICSVLCVLHPVAFAQFFTYYIDGFLWQVFLLCMLCLVYITLKKGEQLTTYCHYMLFVSIVIGLNLKFSSLLYFGLPCIVFLVYWCILSWKKEKVKFIKSTLKSFFVLVISVIIGTCYVGSTSYIVNIIRHKNPLYTMIGEGSTDLVTVQLPLAYQDMSNGMRFVASFFSKTNGSKAIEQIEWKIPFTIHPGEFVAAQSCDVRTAGWGILFSGIFLISIVVIVKALIKHRKRNKEIFNVVVLVFAIMIASILFVPGLSWARYFGALFYVPPMAVVYMFVCYNRSRKKANCIMAIVIFVLLVIDMIPNVTLSYKTVVTDYTAISTELEVFRDITEEQEVIIGYNERGRFSGRFFTLDDWGITNYSFEEISEEEATNILFPYYGLLYKIK